MTDEAMTSPETVEETSVQETPVTPSAEKITDPSAEAVTEKVVDSALLESELAQAKERYLRLLADFDNMRKRQARELEERTSRANERLLNSLIPVYDTFEMALQNAPADSFAEGVRMIADTFRKTLEQSGAELIDAQGQAFDPMLHEVLSMIPDEKVPQGEIISQFRKGWKLGGKVIRPAQVVVSAGVPPAPVAEEVQ
ncbi:MAG: nucleotide exchange factor GrpE [Kiritimatiellia bacterium]